MSLDAREANELRALHEKAYRRDGGLTEADAERLRELEARRFGEREDSVVEERDAGESTRDDETQSSVPHRVSSPSPALPRSTSEEGELERDEVPTARGILRRFWLPVAASAVLLLAVGVGAGWALFGRGADAGIPLTRDQEQRRVELSLAGEDEPKYDEGSVRALGEEGDVLAWYATRKDGELVCVILDVAEQSSEVCEPEEKVRAAGVSTSILEFEGEGRSVYASILYDATGDPVVVIQSSIAADTQLDSIPVEHRDRAEKLEEGGFLFPTIVGFFRDQPVWSVTRADDDGPGDLCLIADAGVGGQITCVPLTDASETGLTSSVALEDGTAWKLELRYSEWQLPYLTITQQVSRTVQPGETLEIGGEYGDPIEVTPEAPKG